MMELPENHKNQETNPEALDKTVPEQKVQEANDERGTFRAYDMNQNGEIRTIASDNESLYPEAQATLYGRDGEARPL